MESDGAYVTYTPAGGADPVTKKLGDPNIEYTESDVYSADAEHTHTFTSDYDKCIVICSVSRTGTGVSISESFSSGDITSTELCSLTTTSSSSNANHNGLKVLVLENVKSGDTVTLSHVAGRCSIAVLKCT